MLFPEQSKDPGFDVIESFTMLHRASNRLSTPSRSVAGSTEACLAQLQIPGSYTRL